MPFVLPVFADGCRATCKLDLQLNPTDLWPVSISHCQSCQITLGFQFMESHFKGNWTLAKFLLRHFNSFIRNRDLPSPGGHLPTLQHTLVCFRGLSSHARCSGCPCRSNQLFECPVIFGGFHKGLSCPVMS